MLRSPGTSFSPSAVNGERRQELTRWRLLLSAGEPHTCKYSVSDTRLERGRASTTIVPWMPFARALQMERCSGLTDSEELSTPVGNEYRPLYGAICSTFQDFHRFPCTPTVLIPAYAKSHSFP